MKPKRSCLEERFMRVSKQPPRNHKFYADYEKHVGMLKFKSGTSVVFDYDMAVAALPYNWKEHTKHASTSMCVGMNLGTPSATKTTPLVRINRAMYALDVSRVKCKSVYPHNKSLQIYDYRRCNVCIMDTLKKEVLESHNIPYTKLNVDNLVEVDITSWPEASTYQLPELASVRYRITTEGTKPNVIHVKESKASQKRLELISSKDVYGYLRATGEYDSLVKSLDELYIPSSDKEFRNHIRMMTKGYLAYRNWSLSIDSGVGPLDEILDNQEMLFNLLQRLTNLKQTNTLDLLGQMISAMEATTNEK